MMEVYQLKESPRDRELLAGIDSMITEITRQVGVPKKYLTHESRIITFNELERYRNILYQKWLLHLLAQADAENPRCLK